MAKFCVRCNPYPDIPTDDFHMAPEMCRDALKHEVARLLRENDKMKKRISYLERTRR